MIRHPQKFPVSKKDLRLWAVIVAYIGVIYSTLSVVPPLRKWLVERFGYTVYDYLFPLFALIGLFFVVHGMRAVRGTALACYFFRIIAIGSLYVWYLLSLPYAVERVHLLEYGGLGILLFIACYRKIHNFISIPLALLLCYLTGLGDEAIQNLIPNRVAEIRDSITNAVSGLLGLLLFLFSQGTVDFAMPPRPAHLRAFIALAGVCAAATGLFIYSAHGFGYEYRNCESGTMYSSLSRNQFERINGSGGFSSPREKKTYENEAKRHLFQRDFYFTNDFLANSGAYYRQYARAVWENRILESWYGRFLAGHGRDSSALYSGKFDKKVGRDLGGTPIVWTGEIRNRAELKCGNPDAGYASRVKSTIITGFTLRDLLFYEMLAIIVFVWCWVLLLKRDQVNSGQSIPGPG